MKNYCSVKIDFYEKCTVTREADPDSQWEAGDLAWDIRPNHFSVYQDRHTHDMKVVPFIPEFDRPYYLVAVYHCGGDYYHSETGCFHTVGLYQDKNLAEHVKNLILTHWYSRSNSYDFKRHLEIPYPDGVVRKYVSTPWTGYFNDFERCEVFELYRR